MKQKITTLLIFTCCVLAYQLQAQEKNLIVKINDEKSEIQSTMWGIFFEDINFAADGGIYAELVKNRSFEFFNPLMGWQFIKPNNNLWLQIVNRSQENPANPRYARIFAGSENDSTGLINEGFRGMGIKKGTQYNFSILARLESQTDLKIKISLLNSKNEVIGSSEVVPNSSEWKKYSVNFIASGTDAKCRLKILFEGKGILDIDFVSLFPGDTWKNRPGGLRADLVQLLADLKPGFIRFPGGCIVEGRELATRYQWKKTVGPVENRSCIVNRWNTEFSHRPTPDYFQSFGLGFYEYFLLAEDIGAEPLPVLSCGIACQFNTAEIVPLNLLEPYIQDALDLIEFANGAADSKWGKIRSDMGHPLPFNLKMIGVGNEQWGPQYFERYKIFASRIKEKYPNIKIISSAGPFPDGNLFEFASSQLRTLNAEIVDEHYYANPDWFLKNVCRYDKYDEKGYRIFAGEYAAQSKFTCSPDNQNNWKCAIAEAAYMTGLERNAGVVNLCSYAPLFAHTEAWQWTPDLIWFDNLKSFGTANYYVQKMYSNYRGTNVLPILLNDQIIAGQDGLYASAVIDKNSEEIIIKVVNTKNEVQTVSVVYEGAKKLEINGNVTILKSDNPDAVNSLESPLFISPREEKIKINSNKATISLEANSFEVIRVKIIEFEPAKRMARQ